MVVLALTAAPSPQFQLDRMTFFDGTLHVKGHLFCPGRRVAAMHLALGDGWLEPFVRFALASPDLAAQFGSSAAAARFDQSFAVPDVGKAARAELVVSWADGATQTLALAVGEPIEESRDLFGRFLQHLRTSPSGRLLEIGSRNRTGANRRQHVPASWEYTGFDILPGENVDIVGDAHRASKFLPHGHFDAVMSSVVFEHLLMPWKAVIEMNRVLRVGALGFITAPQTWPLHEEPADYFRFSKYAWKALLNAATGFEIVAAEHFGTGFIVPSHLNASTAFGEAYVGALGSSVLFRKIGETSLDWPVEMDDIADDRYPV